MLTAGTLTRAGGAPYLHTLLDAVPTAASAGYYARIVADEATNRRVLEAATRITQLVTDRAHDTATLVDLAGQAMYDVTERRGGGDAVTIADLMQPALDQLETLQGKGGLLAGIPTGFGDLDRILTGLHPVVDRGRGKRWRWTPLWLRLTAGFLWEMSASGTTS